MDKITNVRNLCRKLEYLEKRINELRSSKEDDELKEYQFAYENAINYLSQLVNGK